MKRYEDTEKTVHEAAAILQTLAGKKYHEYFVTATPAGRGKHFVGDSNASPSTIIAMVSGTILVVARQTGVEPMAVLHEVMEWIDNWLEQNGKGDELKVSSL